MKDKDRIRRIYKKINLHKETSESLLLGVMLAIVGGILEAYTFVGRGGVFCNAQTGNMALLGIEASKGEWAQALRYIPPILAFILGIIVAEAIKRFPELPFIHDSERAILILEIVILFIIGLIPKTVPNIFINVTISFVASVQVSSFRTLVDAPYATTMLTGNLRSASSAAYNAFTKKDAESAIRAIRYFAIIFSFILGAFIGGLLTILIGVKAVWSGIFVLLCCLVLFYIEEGKPASI